MRKADPAAVLARAERLVEPKRTNLRVAFATEAEAMESSAVKDGHRLSGPFPAQMHAMCAAQLHARVTLAVDKLLESHRAMRASPSDVHRHACKQWIARRVAVEAEDLQQHLRGPDIGSAGPGRDNEPNPLRAEAQHETASAHAAIDREFDQLKRHRVERVARWTVRLLRAVALSRPPEPDGW